MDNGIQLKITKGIIEVLFIMRMDDIDEGKLHDMGMYDLDPSR